MKHIYQATVPDLLAQDQTDFVSVSGIVIPQNSRGTILVGVSKTKKKKKKGTYMKAMEICLNSASKFLMLDRD